MMLASFRVMRCSQGSSCLSPVNIGSNRSPTYWFPILKLNTNIQRNFPHGSKLILLPLLYAFLASLAIVLPVILWQLNLSIVARTFDGSVPGMLDSQPFELFGLFISILLVLVTWLNIRNQKTKNLKTLTPIILPLLVSLQILFFLVEDSYPKSSDYEGYEIAAQAIVNRVDPYNASPYAYPPLPAQVLVLLYQVVNWGLLFSPGDAEKAWNMVFYFYQCGQYIQILLAYYLTYQLAKRMGLRVIPAILIVSGLFLFNNPLVRTIKFNQINVWMLNCFLLTILWGPRRSFFSGLAVALGTHIKLYTLTLLLPWTVTKQWRAVMGLVTGFSAILMLQTGFGQNWTLWQQFLAYFTQALQEPSNYRVSNYRNTGIWSFVYNLAKIPNRLVDASLFDLVPPIVSAINLLIVAWFILRIFKREKAYSELVKASDSGISLWNEMYRFYGHALDAIALGLLISPSVWEHHYVLAIPIALWAIVTRIKDRPWLTGIGTFLIFGLPTFDVFPLGHHRMLGLLILIYITSPVFVQKYFKLQSPKVV